MRPQVQWEDSNTFEREFQKLKDITLKSVYEKLLSKIKDVNNTLQTLTQQSLDLQKVRGKRGKPQKGFLIYQKIRKHARSLHNAVIGSQCWRCDSRHQHFVNFRLEPGPFGGVSSDSSTTVSLRLGVIKIDLYSVLLPLNFYTHLLFVPRLLL